MKKMTVIPPQPNKEDKIFNLHNDTRIDPYYWLNERGNPKVIQHLDQENTYTQAILAHTEGFQKKIFEEIKIRIKEEDESVPYKYNGYWYITRYKKGSEYSIYSRKKGSLEAREEQLFDVNEMAQDHKYYHLEGFTVSPDNQLVAFGVDTLSRQIYTLYFKDLETGEILSDRIENTTGNAIWATDNQTIFYVKKDMKLRPFQVFKHILGTDSNQDQLIFQEKDEAFYVSVFKTKSEQYLVIGSYSTVSDEYRIIPADKPEASWEVFQAREGDLEYHIDHFGNDFYIVTNKDRATNFKVMKTHVAHTEKTYWTDVIPHRKDYFIENIEIFKNHLVVEQRYNGLIELEIRHWDGSENYKLSFDEETYTASISTNLDFNTSILRYNYSSLTTPISVIDFDMETHQKEIKKEQEILDGKFDKKNYTSERVWAIARDGQKIPISLVRHKDTEKSTNTPLLLYGYGSYGITVDPYFSSTRLSLLDRGFIYAIAHIRGGQYLGRPWYEAGKMLQKKNTFYDFIDCAQHLIVKKYTSSKHLYAMGGSAGGLLMGVVINMVPKLFHGVIAAVPFVDVITTMLDESIPLTSGEYDEWGNPNEKEFYEYIKSYSPYDNVAAYDYPHLLVTTGLHDPQVQYWEPVKWVSKLRELKKGDNNILIHINMDTGHGGASGRFEALKKVALEYVFLLDLEGIIE
ncbi:MAG: S9 family peptidase [Flavobacteriales bacterium AspAUS03]